MSVDVFVLFFSFNINVVSYFENIPSLQSSAIGLTVAHVSLGILKVTYMRGSIKENVAHIQTNRRKTQSSCTS